MQIASLRKLLGPQRDRDRSGARLRFARRSATRLPTAPPPSVLARRAPRGRDAARPSRAAANLPRACRAGAVRPRRRHAPRSRALLATHRLVTVVGAGGIGKTPADAGGRSARPTSFRDGVWWIELAGARRPGAACAARSPAARSRQPERDAGAADARRGDLRRGDALARARQLRAPASTPSRDLVERAAARLRRGLRVLATSQEPLRVPAEQQLPARAAGGAARRGGAERARLRRGRSSSSRARARSTPRFALDDADAAGGRSRSAAGSTAFRSRIELAAARVPLLGLRAARTRGCDERFRLLTGGARTALRAPPDAARDDGLEPRAARRARAGGVPQARRLRRRLHDRARAGGVRATTRIDAWAVLDQLGALVDKSLVVAERPSRAALPPARDDARVRPRAARRRGRDRSACCAARRDACWHSCAAPTTANGQHAAHRRATRRSSCPSSTTCAPPMAGRRARRRSSLVELAGVSSSVWIFASLNLEGIERCAALQARLGDDTPLALRARFWLAHARLGIVTGRRDCYEAACRAAEGVSRARRRGRSLRRALHPGLDRLRTRRIDRGGCGHRRGEPPGARRLPAAPARLVRLDAGALAAGRRPHRRGAGVGPAQAALYRRTASRSAKRSRWAPTSPRTKSSSAASRPPRRAPGQRSSIWSASALPRPPATCAPAWRTRSCCRAKPPRRSSKRGSRCRCCAPKPTKTSLATLAPALAQLGRPADAARIAGFIDADAASAGRLWRITDGRHRRRLDELLGATLTADQIAGLAAAGAALDLDQAFALAFEKAPPRAPFEGEQGESE